MLGWPETLLILAFLFFIFGPEKLSQIAKELGRAWREFRKASSGIEEAADSIKMVESKKTPKTLMSVAKKLNMRTEGKTMKQIAEEIAMIVESKEV